MALSAAVLKASMDAYTPSTDVFVGEKVFPPCPVTGGTTAPDTGVVTAKARRFQRFSNIALKGRTLDHTAGSEVVRIRSQWDEYDITIRPKAVEVGMDKDAFNALPETIGPEAQAQIITPLQWLLRIEREKRAVSLMTDTSNWTAGYTGTAGNRWSDSSFNALDSLTDAVRTMVTNMGGMVPNGLVLSIDAWYALIQNPSIKQGWGSTPLDFSISAVRERLASMVLGVMREQGPAPEDFRIHICRATVDDTNLVATGTPAQIMSNFAALFYAPQVAEGQTTNHQTIAAGKTYFAGGMDMVTYPENKTREIVTQAAEKRTPGVVDANALYYFSNIVTA
jgi:hypothetical protein